MQYPFACLMLAFGIMCIMTLEKAPCAERELSGASAAFTSDDPLIVQARELMKEGQFAQAEKMLREADQSKHPAAGELLDVIGRIRGAYRLDANALLAKLRISIPDVSAQDLERWRLAGQVQYRVIDGQVSYFEREPSNIFRFCDEAKKRRKQPAAATPQWKLEDHLLRVIETAQREGKADVVPIRHRVKYVLTIQPDAPHLALGAMLRVWLPFPQEYLRQRDVKLTDASPGFNILAPSAMGENPIEGPAQRTIYFEKRITETGKPITFEEGFEFTNSAYYPNLDDALVCPLPANWAGAYLKERPPHIHFTPQLQATVAKIVGDEKNPLARARRIYHYITSNISYCAEEEYSTIPSICEKAFTTRRGDCGVQSLLFITMCRIAGIPARWQSGWETRRTGPDMHDWTEVYVQPWGWLPADPSYGLRESSDPRVREFYFGHQDSYRMIVNRDYGVPLEPPKRALRSEPLDFQRGEVEVIDSDGTPHNLYFPFWDFDFTVEYLNDGP